MWTGDSMMVRVRVALCAVWCAHTVRTVDGLHEAFHLRVPTGTVHLHHHLLGARVPHKRLDSLKLASLAVNLEEVDWRPIV